MTPVTARCCYSCRAFFRRRAQRAESHRCRSSVAGDCAITAASKKCISCRYNKCLSIGMDPALVRVSAASAAPLKDILTLIISGSWKQEEEIHLS